MLDGPAESDSATLVAFVKCDVLIMLPRGACAFGKVPEVMLEALIAEPLVRSVPDVAGKSNTVVPATAGSCNVTLPLVDPIKTMLIILPTFVRLAQLHLRRY